MKQIQTKRTPFAVGPPDRELEKSLNNFEPLLKPRPPVSPRAQVLAALIDAILRWDSGDESDDLSEKHTATDVTLVEGDTPSAADANDGRTFTSAGAEAQEGY